MLHITLFTCGKSKRDKSKLDISPAMMLGNRTQLSFLCLLWALVNQRWLVSLEAERQTKLKEIYIYSKKSHTRFSFVYHIHLRCWSDLAIRMEQLHETPRHVFWGSSIQPLPVVNRSFSEIFTGFQLSTEVCDLLRDRTQDSLRLAVALLLLLAPLSAQENVVHLCISSNKA